MNTQEILIAILLTLFYFIGGIIDTYTSHRFFPPKVHPPKWLARTFLFWWLVVFVGILPFLIAFVASGYSLWVIKVFVTFLILGSVIWDLIFSKIWSGKWISKSCETWFWLGSFNLGFDEKTIIPFHLLRIAVFFLAFYLFFLR
jgi:hypothetical protein